MGRSDTEVVGQRINSVNMKVLLILAIAVVQIKSQGAGSSHAGMGSSGYGGDWMSGGEECCPTKMVWGSIKLSRDGIYDLDMASSSGYGEEMHRPRRCRRDLCIYKKRDGTSEDGTDWVRYCFAPSE